MSASVKGASVELPIEGMDCADCANHVQHVVGAVPGVRDVHVLLAAERATISYDPDRVTLDQLKAAVAGAGYRVRESAAEAEVQTDRWAAGQVISWSVLGTVAAVVLVATLGEQLGLFDRVLERLPWWIPALAILLGGWPVFQGVLQAARGHQITSHTLMTVGVVASIAIDQWTTAVLIVFFMRFGSWLEDLTTERNRQALKQLVALQPATAHVLRDGHELAIPVAEVMVGDVVLVRPGDRIPVDGRVLDGQAPVDQGPITGESVPVEKTTGDVVFAATVAQAGFLKVEATAATGDTTFARIVRLVEEAEAHKAPVQRFADRFSAYYLPSVLLIALGTYLVSRNAVSAVAVLVVACACAIVIATPVVVLASVGTAARRGLLIKGGSALEQLAHVDTVVVDKTGTLTQGRPEVTDVVALNGLAEHELLHVVATVESRSEHPLARAIVRAASVRGIAPAAPECFTPLPGRGVTGTVDGREWYIGNRQLLAERGMALDGAAESGAQALEAGGKTVFFVADGGGVAGLVALADTIRPEAKAALADLRRLGLRRLLLLTGDNERVAAAIAGELGVEYRAELLPHDKIAVVQALQAEGARVMMVGDGVNDAPALAQADVGVAMGVAGTAVAVEAAGVVLMRDDWRLVPEAIRIGRRGVRTIRQNLAFTAFYNVAGLSLAALGILPPVWAAAAQSLPDVAIMLNSARLLRGSSTEQI
ncbi:MAG: cadmium-translocating P-type ATPase [Chloroflexi bacterium]|nr:cadmium-translocating P-type ATPase [Chloroflexota bacterium]